MGIWLGSESIRLWHREKFFYKEKLVNCFFLDCCQDLRLCPILLFASIFQEKMVAAHLHSVHSWLFLSSNRKEIKKYANKKNGYRKTYFFIVSKQKMLARFLAPFFMFSQPWTLYMPTLLSFFYPPWRDHSQMVTHGDPILSLSHLYLP